jgi:hypothetical protein
MDSSSSMISVRFGFLANCVFLLARLGATVRSLRAGGQGDDEGGAFAGFAFHVDEAVVFLYDSVGN